MARRDFYHNVVKRALEKDGWTITAEPLFLSFPSTQLECDLAAEKFVAQRGLMEIAVEVKNFRQEGKMNMNELKTSIGQYIIYSKLINRQFPNHKLYLAVPEDAYKNVFTLEVIKEILLENNAGLLVFSPNSETIVAWQH